MHGHNFSVMRSAESSSYNFDTPVIRDVVNLGTTSVNVTIRFLLIILVHGFSIAITIFTWTRPLSLS